MQTQHRRFFDSLEWEGYHGGGGVAVSGDHKDVDEMLDELGRLVYNAGQLEEYKQSQRYTKPSERKRKERETQGA
jgi:ribosomal protein S21